MHGAWRPGQTRSMSARRLHRWPRPYFDRAGTSGLIFGAAETLLVMVSSLVSGGIVAFGGLTQFGQRIISLTYRRADGMILSSRRRVAYGGARRTEPATVGSIIAGGGDREAEPPMPSSHRARKQRPM